MRKLTILMAVGLLFGAGQAIAQDDEEEMSGADEAAEAVEEVGEEAEESAAEVIESSSSSGAAYGSAGCGLGSMVFDADNGFTQIFAATTNGTSASQTFGITSGTSNCDGSPAGAQSAKAFVETNRVALAKDISRGKGETISSLAHIAGCGETEAVGRSLQKNFKAIFPSAQASDDQVSSSVVDVLKSDASLACGNLG